MTTFLQKKKSCAIIPNTLYVVIFEMRYKEIFTLQFLITMTFDVEDILGFSFNRDAIELRI